MARHTAGYPARGPVFLPLSVLGAPWWFPAAAAATSQRLPGDPGSVGVFNAVKNSAPALGEATQKAFDPAVNELIILARSCHPAAD